MNALLQTLTNAIRAESVLGSVQYVGGIQMNNGKWLTNTHETKENKTIRQFARGHAGLRQIKSGAPKPSKKYTEQELSEMGMVGIYQVDECECSFCANKNAGRF